MVAASKDQGGGIILNVSVSLLVSSILGGALLPYAIQSIHTLESNRFRSRIERIKNAASYAYFVACPFGVNTSPVYPPAGNCASVHFPSNGFQSIADEGLIPQNALAAYTMSGSGNSTLTVQGATVTLSAYSNAEWLMTVACPVGSVPNLCLSTANRFQDGTYDASSNTISFYLTATHLPMGNRWGFVGDELLGQLPLGGP